MERLTKKSEIFGDITFRGDGCTLDQVKQRLFDYEEAEEQGLLIRLPFCVGDIVYWAEKEVYPFEIKEMRIDKFGIDARFAYRGTDENKQYWEVIKYIDLVCEKVFLTMEEAEAALERMK